MSNEGKDYKSMDDSEVLHELKSDKSLGLSESEAKQRLAKYGFNEIPEKEETFLHRVLRRFWGPIPWMIEIAAILSAAVQKWEDFGIITTLLLVNAFIDLWQESKALDALSVLKKKLAKKATVLRDGKFKLIDAKELVPGDIIKIKIGEILPADVKLIEGEYIQIDQSALTGESLPVTKHSDDIAYANSVVKQGEMISVVTQTGLNTYFGKTVSLVAKAEKEQKSHFQKMVIKVGNYLIFTTLSMVILIILTALYRHEDMINILRFALVLTVAAIPVALPAVLTVTMAVGAINLSKKQAIVSRLAAIEELAGIDILCSDKTGTLTKNTMTVAQPVTYNGFQIKDLMIFAALSSKEENNDPIETPIFEYIKKNNLSDDLTNYKIEKFIPFDPVNKRTEAVVNKEGKRITVTKGAPQVILKLSSKGIDSESVSKTVSDFASKGYRTLGTAVKNEEDKNYKFVGIIPLYDPPRDDAMDTIAEAEKLGLNVKMVTGDNVAIAKQISEQLGLNPNILEADQLKAGTNAEFIKMTEILARTIHQQINPELPASNVKELAKQASKEFESTIQTEHPGIEKNKKHESEMIRIIEGAGGFAQVFPEDKYTIVEQLQKGNHIVGMTGDGVNDAPALKKADAGIAVAGATDAARAAADLVLMAPGISVIIDAIKQARIIFERMKSYAIYRIAETIRVIFFMTLSIIIFNFYPVTAIMIIILALLNDIPIITIAYDNTRIDPSPVKWNNRELFGLSTLLGVAGVISSFLIFFLLETYSNLPQQMIQTAIFTKLIIAGHATIFNTRTTDWFFKKPFPSKPLLFASLLTALLGLLVGVYGIFVPAVGWKWGLIVTIYAFAWFTFNDVVKVFFYRNFLNKNRIFHKYFRQA
jgi:H+-transporting ATPase